MPPDGARFGALDWIVLAAYLVAVVLVGLAVSRRKPSGDDFFLAGRRMPMWAVAISVLATSLSAATFVGGPEQSYAGDLTYFSSNLGGLVAVVVVAVLFIPAFYRHRVTSIYELLGHTCGDGARRGASVMFMVGRVFASGARLFVVAIPFALAAFGEATPGALLGAVWIIAAGAAAYTLTGGIRAVIWTDVLQAAVVVGTVAAALAILMSRIPLAPAETIAALRDASSGDKLRILDLDVDPAKQYTLWTALVGFTLFGVAAYGTDQDLTQRMLTCRSARSGAWSVVAANLLGMPVLLLFLAAGLLLHVYYNRPDLMGAAAPAYEVPASQRVFVVFMLRELPSGLRGLMMAGLFAAAMSSLDSALGAMASTTIADFHRPWRRRRDPAAAPGDAREVRAGRLAVAAWALALAGFASVCIFWQRASGTRLIDFALGVMVFAYAGLLGVFLTALLTRRGNSASALAALVTGFVAVLLMQDGVRERWAPALGLETKLAFPWQMTIATALSFGTCMLGRRKGPRDKGTKAQRAR